jgi:hypothetical protein
LMMGDFFTGLIWLMPHHRIDIFVIPMIMQSPMDSHNGRFGHRYGKSKDREKTMKCTAVTENLRFECLQHPICKG